MQKILEDYNALSENAKALVPNYRKLADAEEFINTDFGNLNGDDKITAEDILALSRSIFNRDNISFSAVGKNLPEDDYRNILRF